MDNNEDKFDLSTLFDIVVTVGFTYCLSYVKVLALDHPRRRFVDFGLLCAFAAFCYGSFLTVPPHNLRVRLVSAAVSVIVFRVSSNLLF